MEEERPRLVTVAKRWDDGAKAMKDALGKESQMIIRNVIVLGCSQHGKTTFLNSVSGWQGGQTAGDGRVGDGSSSCTSVPSAFKLHSPGQPTASMSYTRLPDPSQELIQLAMKVDERVEKGEKEEKELDEARRVYWEQLRENPDFQAHVSRGAPCVIGRNLVEGVDVGKRFKFGLTQGPTLELGMGAVELSMPNFSMIPRFGVRFGLSAPPEAQPGHDHGVDAAVPVQIHALDTPGVDDSKGKDDEHIEAVIDAVLEMETLSGLVMVTKCGISISPSWRAQVLRYWNLFPMMQSQWIFVHTNADPFAVNAPQRQDASSFERACMDRASRVTEAMREVTGNEMFEASHIFIEANVRRDQTLQSFLAEQHNSLFTLICNFSPTVVDTLCFTKGPALLELDARVCSALDAMINAVTMTLLEVHKEMGELLELRNRHANQRKDLEFRLQKTCNRLREIDHEGCLENVKYVDKPWQWWYFPEAQVDIVTKHRMYDVSIIDTSGYRQTYLIRSRLEVLDNFPDGTEKLRISLQVPCTFTTMKGKIVVSSKSCDVNELKISELRKIKEEVENDLADKKRTHQELESMHAAKVDIAELTDRRNQTAQAVKLFLSNPWPMHVWRSMKPFYTKFKKIPNPDAHSLLSCFQEQWRQYMQEEGIELGFEPEDISVQDSVAAA